MRYKVCYQYDKLKFEKEVEQCIKEGWKLQGGVSSSLNEINEFVYSQAVIKEEE